MTVKAVKQVPSEAVEGNNNHAVVAVGHYIT